MSTDFLAYRADLEEYQRQAEALFAALESGDRDAQRRLNWEHPRFRGRPLHQALWANHPDVVRLLAERGARLDIEDTIYRGTPLDWAVYGERHATAEYLRGRASAADRLAGCPASGNVPTAWRSV